MTSWTASTFKATLHFPTGSVRFWKVNRKRVVFG